MLTIGAGSGDKRVPIDIFDTDRPAPDRVFRYPLYERFMWLVAVAAGILAVVFRRHVRDFLETERQRGLVILAVAATFVLITIWVSLRAWVSKVVISPVSLKARVFGQGVQRISWVHIQRVFYKWRPLGHKLIFVGSDGAKVTIRSSINGYDELMAFIRENAPEPVLDQLDDIFGEEEPEEEADKEPKGESEEKPAEAPKPEPPSEPPADDDEAEDEEASEEQGPETKE